MCNTFCFPASPQFPLVPLSLFSIVLHVSIWDRCVLVMAPVLSILAYSHRYIGHIATSETTECLRFQHFWCVPSWNVRKLDILVKFLLLAYCSPAMLSVVLMSGQDIGYISWRGMAMRVICPITGQSRDKPRLSASCRLTS